MKEVVVDTNIFVSGLLTPGGLPRSLLEKIVSGEIGLVTSPRLLFEILSVFSRPKFKVLIPESKISGLISLIHESARIIKPSENIIVCRDPKDNAVLECALAGRVSAVVTGDDDLLVLNPFRGIPILTPKNFLLSLESD